MNGPEGPGATLEAAEEGDTGWVPSPSSPVQERSLRPQGIGGAPARIRPAVPTDAAEIYALVCELADYEREPTSVEATPDDFRAALFGPQPRVHCHVAEVDAADGPQVVGMALWFVTFSTWRGRHGIWLEDLYVRADHRRGGLGRALLAELAAVCRDRGYRRLEWSVLDWNALAHDFYASLGAVPQGDWTTWRLDRDALVALAHDTP